MMEYQIPKSYFPTVQDNGSGFRFRVDGSDVVQQTIDALRGGVTKNAATGKPEYNEKFRMMNDLGISRAQFFLKSIVNKNTHLSKFKDEERIMRQIRALSKEWCVTLAQNRKRWMVQDPDLVQQTVETGILAALLRADEGFEAEISGKSHQVNENINRDQTPQQQNGFSRFFNWGGGQR